MTFLYDVVVFSRTRLSRAIIAVVFFSMICFVAQGQTLTVLVNFDGSGGNLHPQGSLAQGVDGNFYGVTNSEIFKVTPGSAFSVVAHFNTFVNGEFAGLVLAPDGNFYGQTDRGGNQNYPCPQCGAIFRATPSGQLTVLKALNAAIGRYPIWPVALASDGSIYAPTDNGGSSGGCGTVIHVLATGQTNVALNFDHANGCKGASLVAGADENMYGVASQGGIESANCPQGAQGGCGTIFTLTEGGQETTLYQFDGSSGYGPGPALVEGNDGNFYGVTTYATGGTGTVFCVSPSGALSFLHIFTGVDGSYPYGPLVLGNDGNFYGTTQQGGTGTCSAGCGTIFRITPEGQLTTLIDFDGTGTGQTPYG